MDETELKLAFKRIDEFIEHTQKNFAQLFKDRAHDYTMLEDLTRDLGKVKVEVELLRKNVSEATDSVRQTEKEIKREVAQAISDLREELSQKKIIQLPAKPKRHWWQSIWPFRKEVKK